MTEVDDVSNMNLLTVVSEVNFIGNNTKEWWVDTGATRHVCSDKMMFSSYHSIDNGEQLFMGNFSSSKVEGQEKVVLKMTSGKELTLGGSRLQAFSNDLQNRYSEFKMFLQNIKVKKET